jgi:putative ABC transport system permease protein
METLIADVRYGLRFLWKKPGITLVALVTLALGIGANTAIFSVVNAVLLRPLPYSEPEELVMVWQDHTRIDGPATEWAAPDNFVDWRAQNDVFQGMFALSGWSPTLTGVQEPEQLNGAAVSYDAFSLLGTKPMLGRDFRPEEDQPKAARVVLLSHSLWERRFASRPDVIGKTMRFEKETATIIGVMPPELAFPVLRKPEIFTPLAIDPADGCGRGCVTLRVIGRLKPGVPLARARADMNAVAARLEQEYPQDNRGVGINLVPLQEQVVGPIRPALVVLLGAVALVLLIACANVASLVLARASDREKEVATRIAMGAGRFRVVRQLLTESLLLAAFGGTLGVLLALWGIDVLRGLVPGNVPRFDEVTVDTRVLAFTTGIALATGVLFGLVPAVRASLPDLHRSLKEGARGSTAGSGRLFRSALIVSEVAFALALLIGASLLIRSFDALLRVDRGFEARNVLTVGLNLASPRYEEAMSRRDFIHRVLDRTRALPGVESAGMVYALPMAGADADASFLIEGREPPEPNQSPVAWYRPVTPNYFSTMKMKLVRGRFFRESDDAEAPPVVLINETAVARYWRNQDPLASRVQIGREWRQVVGVVADTKHFGLDREDRPAMYLPYDQIPLRSANLVLRASPGTPPESLAAPMRDAIREIDPELALADVAPLEDIIARTVAAPKVTTTLFAVFAAVALGLAAIGLYGVMSYTVGQTTHEIGIRMALGARAQDVLRATVGRGMRLIALGAGIGLTASLLLSRLLSSLLFGVTTTDPMAFVAAVVVLALVAFVSCFLPARRAARVDPIVALRYE